MRNRRIRKITILALLSVAVGVSGGTYAALSGSTSNSGNSFSAASSFGGCSATNPSAVWMTGMEHGVVSTNGASLFNYAVGATADSATKRTGSYSLRLAPSAGVAAYAGPTIAGTAGVMRFAMRLPSLPGADVAQLAMLYSTTGSALQLGYRASDQKLTLSWAGTDLVASTTTIAAGTWYVIDIRGNVAASPRVGNWAINGVAQPTSSHVEAATTFAVALFGSFNATDVYTAHYDDISVSSTAADYPIGDGRIKALSPDGVSTHSNPANFSHDGGAAIDATSWNRLDDVPMTSTADAVQQTTNSGTSYLGFTFANPADSCVRAVSAVVAYRSSGNAANNGKTSIFDGAVERAIYSGDMSDTSLFYKSAVIDPDTAPWTQSAVNGLISRVGFSTDVNPIPMWDALMLEYETP